MSGGSCHFPGATKMLNRLLDWLAGGCWHRWEVAWVDGVGFTYRCQRCRLCRPYPLPWLP